jgi:TPR repeat protein
VPQEHGLAAKWFREAAEQGDAAAQLIWGFVTRWGGACAKFHGAFRVISGRRRARRAPEPNSMWVYYETGQVVPRDFAEAAKWHLAAAGGDARRHGNLGLCYETGRGVRRIFGP